MDSSGLRPAAASNRAAGREEPLHQGSSGGILRRFFLLFIVFAGVGFAVLLGPLAAPAMGFLTRSLAWLAAGLIHIGGGRVSLSGDTLTAPGSGFGVVVENGCNGINVLILLWSAQLAWPSGWLDKLKKMAVGALIILPVNILRIVTLFYLGQWNQEWFEWMHLYVWEILIMVLGLSVFALGIRRTPESAVSGGNQ